MALSNYDPKLLNFLYELTKLDRPMSYREISNKIRLEGRKISPKTVERWFNFLKKPYNHPKSKTKDKFDYFPKFYYEKLGLINVHLASSDPKKIILEEKFLSNYQNYAVWVYDLGIGKSLLYTGYLVPFELYKKFSEHIENLAKKRLIGSYSLYKFHSSFMIYSPWHEVIDKNGIFHPEKNNIKKIDLQIEKLSKYLENLPEFKIVDGIKRNPLAIPVLFEYWWECKSSYSVWASMKRKFGSRAWNFIRKAKVKSEGVGVKKVQETLETIQNDKISEGMKLIYMPLELDNIFIYSVLNFKDRKEMLHRIKEIALKCLQVSIYPISDKKSLLISLTNAPGMKSLLNIFERSDVEKIHFLQHEKSLPTLTTIKHIRFNYEKNFNPLSGEWKKIFLKK